MRFSRDKRGYENTFVVHTERGRRGKPQSRILYWFRTPPGVRVGRSALDEEAIRLIEEHNPDVEFDWTRILKRQVPETAKPSPRSAGPGERRADGRREWPDRHGRRRDVRGETDRSARPEAVARQDAMPSRAATDEPETEEISAAEPEPAEISGEPIGIEDSALIDAALDDVGIAESLLAEDLVDGIGEFREPEPAPELRLAAAEERLGAEGVLRLRARYSEVLARISERVQDPVRAEELKAQAERLNPDTWVTAEEVTQGIEQYEAVFESLRGVVGRNRKRRRRRRVPKPDLQVGRADRRPDLQVGHGDRRPDLQVGREEEEEDDGNGEEEGL